MHKLRHDTVSLSSSSSSRMMMTAMQHRMHNRHCGSSSSRQAAALPARISAHRATLLQRRHITSTVAAASSSSSASTAPAAAAIPALAPTAAAAASAAAVTYDADYTADMWSRRPVTIVARLLEIIAAFGTWWAKAQLHKDTQKAAADMRTVLVDLGPAFVKIGQALSSRPDVLPPEYLTELELLQDRIPPFSDREALQVIEEELGVSWRTVFSSLSPTPVAAASLGQVYRGVLAANGAEVAVKVQRPGVVDAIGRDTFILRHLAAIARRQLKLNTDLPALVDEWAASLFKELDYRREAANAIRFSQLFSFMPEVVVPHMYTEYTTPRVLVMEWIEGERLRTASQQTPAAAAVGSSTAASSSSSSGQQRIRSADQVKEDLRLVEIGVRCSLEQMLEEGFYHADPHPGNLLKTKDGRLAYLDFGMMGEIEPPVRQALIRATLHLVNREYERLAEDFVVLGLLPRGTDLDDVIPALTGVFQKALSGGVSNISFSTLSTDLGRTMYKYSFRIPPYYTLLVRSLSVLEGIALASDPNYKVLGAAYPWVSRRLLTQNSSELHATLNNLLYDKSGHFNFDRLESLLEQAAKAAVAPASAAAAAATTTTAASSSSNGRTGVAVVNDTVISSILAPVQILTGPAGQLLGSFIPAFGSSSVPGQQQQQYSGRGSEAAAAGGPLALLLSPEGGYIRGILENELAKGLDAAWRIAVDQTLDNATHQIEGLVASLPVSLPLLPPRQQPSSSSSSRFDLLQTLMNVPRLATAEDLAQIDGLTRLATQLAAFSTQQQQQGLPGSSSSSSSVAFQQQQAMSDQLQQTARILNWLLSEVQLLSPEARREALAIPMNVLSKLASRLAARAVRAVLTPTSLPTAAAAGSSSSSSSSVRVHGSNTDQTPSSSDILVATTTAAADSGSSSAAPAAAAATRSTLYNAPTKPQQQQQQQQQRSGKRQAKTPAQRQLIYEPDVQIIMQQQQQLGSLEAASLSLPAAAAAATPLAAAVKESTAAAAAVINAEDRWASEYVSTEGSMLQQQQQQQQQQPAERLDDNADRGSGSNNSTSSSSGLSSSVAKQEDLLMYTGGLNGSSSSNGRASTSDGGNALIGSTAGSSSSNGRAANGANAFTGSGSSSSSNGWVDEIVVVEVDAVLEPVDALQQ